MTDRQAEFTHIKVNLLDAGDDNHPISIVLRANSAMTIRGLVRLSTDADAVNALTYIDPDDGEVKQLSVDHKEELLGIISYRNLLQNEHGSNGSLF